MNTGDNIKVDIHLGSGLPTPSVHYRSSRTKRMITVFNRGGGRSRTAQVDVWQMYSDGEFLWGVDADLYKNIQG